MKTFEVILSHDRLIAKTNIPEIMEHGIVFDKDEISEIFEIDFERQLVGMKNKWDNILEYFSLQDKHKNINYLWEWFRKV